MKRLKSSRTSDLLVEIGTEEIPAAYLDGAIVQLRENAERCWREAHLDFKTVEAFGTPRRLVLWVCELASTQHHPPEEIRGPSKQAAYDASGKPTQALLGFLKARAGTAAQTKLVETERGAYVYLLKPAREVPTVTVLPQLVAQLVTRLKFPKTMRWDESGLRFARPIRWHVVLYGSRVVPVRLGRLTSGRATWVGGPKRPRAVSVTNPAQYFALLKRAGVTVDPYQRAGCIDQLVKTLAKKHGGVPAAEMVSHGLLDEVSALVEQPVALVGQFDSKYLALPREVLLASMAKYQRVFAIQSRSGKLLPKFVAILDGTPRRLADVRRTFEFILNARLADSLLFWSQDHQRLPLGKFGSLASVTFHEKLGSMEEKTQRMWQLSGALAETWQLTGAEREHLQRACLLAKYDLISAMVKEFPTLQGMVGKYYARDSKEKPEVAKAIGEQYLPAGDQAPKMLIGSALALIDKYDTLASYFTIGIEPTGDQDPFGLRRAAQGIVEIAWAVHRPLRLALLFSTWQAHAPFARGKGHVGNKIQDYLQERLYTFAWPRPTPSRDLIDAVVSRASDDVVDTMDRIRALWQMDGAQALVRAAKVVERTHNILKGTTPQQADVDRARLQEPLEQQLYALYESKKDEFARLVERRSYDDATKLFAETFYTPLHEFFDKVMVNAPDEALRQNRLALMKAINVLYTDRIADLSKLAILQPHPMAAQVGT